MRSARQSGMPRSVKDDGTNEYKYDSWNHLIEVKRKSDSAVIGSYQYDAVGLGRRTKKTADSLTTRFVYADMQSVEELDDSDSDLLRLYVFGQQIDQVVMMEAPDQADVDDDSNTSEIQRFFFHTQLIGSVTHVTDASQATVESYEYDPYGKPTVKDIGGSTVSASPIGNSYLFTGRQLDEESGLYYYRARHYGSSLRRFIQRDPSEYAECPNAMSYVRANPIRRTDPSGLCSVGIGGAVVSAPGPPAGPLPGVNTGAPPEITWPGDPPLEDEEEKRRRKGETPLGPGTVADFGGSGGETVLISTDRGVNYWEFGIRICGEPGAQYIWYQTREWFVYWDGGSSGSGGAAQDNIHGEYPAGAPTQTNTTSTSGGSASMVDATGGYIGSSANAASAADFTAGLVGPMGVSPAPPGPPYKYTAVLVLNTYAFRYMNGKWRLTSHTVEVISYNVDSSASPQVQVSDASPPTSVR